METAAQTTLDASRSWPDSIDVLAIAAFLALVFLVPALGYFFMVADFRAYLRSLKRQLMRIVPLGRDGSWSSFRETPSCVAALGLQMPCTAEQIKEAYREKVKQLHPDRGGDMRRFLRLQSQFEDALRVVGHDSDASIRTRT
ncbi:MAG: J domain-containing protein [Pirellulales bacterium]|nr:J domain-containing protein [Pirellulales bacterium]